jgi:acyl carrier protein
MQTQQLPAREEIITLVVGGLSDTLAQNDITPAEALGEGTYLIGRRSMLDSLGLVTLIVDLEQRIEEQYDVALTLANDRAMSQKNSPFLTVGSLADYILTLIAEERGA